MLTSYAKMFSVWILGRYILDMLEGWQMVKGLQKVGSIYYFQKRLPEKVAVRIGMKLFKRSLETDSLSQSEKYVIQLNEVFRNIFRELKRPYNAYDNYSGEDLLKLLTVEFYKVIDKDSKRVIATLENKYLSVKPTGKHFKTLIDLYINYIDEVKHLSDNSIRSYKVCLMGFFKPVLNATIDVLTPDKMRELIDIDVKANQVNTVKDHIVKNKTFFKWIEETEEITFDSKVIKVMTDANAGLKSEKVRDALTIDQLKLFFGAKYIEEFSTPYLYFPLLLCYVCGLRINESLSLQVRDLTIYKNRYVIQIRDGKTENAKRYVILPRILNKLGMKLYLDDLLKTNPNPESSLWGRAVRYNYISAKVKNHLIALGIKENGQDRRYTEHSLRHSFATKLIASSVDERYAKRYFGHSGSSLMTNRYMIQTPEIEDILNQVDAKLDFDEELADLKPLLFTSKDDLILERKRFVRKYIKQKYKDLGEHFNTTDETTANLFEQYYTEYKTKSLEDILLEEEPEEMVNRSDVALVMAYLTRLKRLFKI